jgi:hypothetical protein
LNPHFIERYTPACQPSQALLDRARRLPWRWMHGHAESCDERRVSLVGLRAREFALPERLDRQWVHYAHDVTMRVQIRRELLAPATGRFQTCMHSTDMTVRKPPMQSFEACCGIWEMIRTNLALNIQRTIELEFPDVDTKNG